MSSQRPNILIVDDDETAAEMCRVVLESNGYEHISSCLDSREAMPTIRRRPISVVLLDLFMPHVSGKEILAELNSEHPEIPTIVLTVEDSLETAVECMKIGAFDFLTKPIDRNRLLNAVGTALRIRDLETRIDVLSAERPETEVQNPEIFERIITRNEHMRRIFAYTEQIANSPKAVLITGESGTGKELVARAVHDAGGRGGRFVPVNVAGLDDTMFSDTLFGHRKGAFTGAEENRHGLIERAKNGTLFLDEIGDLEQASQLKLLRLLQEGEYYPLGSDEPATARVRVVAATNADIVARQEDGRFRRDLYYRLLSHHIDIPPLRERPDDIPLLLEHFVGEAARELGRPVPRLPKRAAVALQSYSFPGNVRELQAVAYDALSRSPEGHFDLHSLLSYIESDRAESEPTEGSEERIKFNGRFPTMDEVESHFFSEALRRAGNNQSEAARLLGVSQSTLSRWLKRQRGRQ
mgnify:CR=1 FL=1